jgi:hypothetical protein
MLKRREKILATVENRTLICQFIAIPAELSKLFQTKERLKKEVRPH